MSAPLPPHLDPRGRHRGAGVRRHSVARPLGRVLGALLSLALLVAAGYYWQSYRQISNNVKKLHISVGQPAPHSTTQFNGKDQNILLVGNDDRTDLTAAESKKLHASQDGGSLNTDTMMIVHVPADGSQATLISLPRDSWVHIPQHGYGRLNSAYPDGYSSVPQSSSVVDKQSAGGNLLLSTITNLTGLTINHYIQVDLIGFYRIAQALGGVPVNLCHAVNDTRAANQAAGLTGGSGLKLSAGHHVLNGVQALKFVRQRHFLPQGDLDRIKRQQYFLTAAFRKVASVGILTKFRALGSAVDSSISTDGFDLLQLAEQLQNLSANNIRGKTIPIAGDETIDGQDVLKVVPAKVQAFVARTLNPPTPSPSSSASTAAPGSSASSHAPTPSTSSSSPAPIDAHCIN